MLKRVAAAAALSLVPTVMVAAPRRPRTPARSACRARSRSRAPTGRSPRSSVPAAWDTPSPRGGTSCTRPRLGRFLQLRRRQQRRRGLVRLVPARDLHDPSRLRVRLQLQRRQPEHPHHDRPPRVPDRGQQLAQRSLRHGQGDRDPLLPQRRTYRAWSGAKVSLRQKSCSSCSWKWVRSGTTDRYGRVSLKAYASTTRYWQIATVDTSNTWGKASTTLKR